jgi:hypothetical protein
MHAHEMHAHEMHASEIYSYEIHASEIHAYGALSIRLQDLPRVQKSGCKVCHMLFESVSDLMAPLRGFSPLPHEEIIGFTIQSTA